MLTRMKLSPGGVVSMFVQGVGGHGFECPRSPFLFQYFPTMDGGSGPACPVGVSPLWDPHVRSMGPPAWDQHVRSPGGSVWPVVLLGPTCHGRSVGPAC
jgi:hypothetical protein